jgi:outer membrane protein assembly factor BamB
LGKEWNSFSTEGRKQLTPKILNNNLLDFAYVVKDGDVSMYDTNKAVMDQFYKLGSIVSSPFVANNTVYFGSADGNCYAIGLLTK